MSNPDGHSRRPRPVHITIPRPVSRENRIDRMTPKIRKSDTGTQGQNKNTTIQNKEFKTNCSTLIGSVRRKLDVCTKNDMFTKGGHYFVQKHGVVRQGILDLKEKIRTEDERRDADFINELPRKPDKKKALGEFFTKKIAFMNASRYKEWLLHCEFYKMSRGKRVNNDMIQFLIIFESNVGWLNSTSGSIDPAKPFRPNEHFRILQNLNNCVKQFFDARMVLETKLLEEQGNTIITLSSSPPGGWMATLENHEVLNGQITNWKNLYTSLWESLKMHDEKGTETLDGTLRNIETFLAQSVVNDRSQMKLAVDKLLMD